MCYQISFKSTCIIVGLTLVFRNCLQREQSCVSFRSPAHVERSISGPLSYLWKNKRPTCCHLPFYFTSYVLSMFRTLIYPSSGACDYSVELPHWSYCSWFDVCWSCGVVGLEWCPCCRLKPATRTLLKPNRTKSPTHNEPRTKRPMW